MNKQKRKIKAFTLAETIITMAILGVIAAMTIPGLSMSMQKSEHVSGMKNSKTIIAINTDENADIFKYSDYKIIADAKKIIDEMLEILS